MERVQTEFCENLKYFFHLADNRFLPLTDGKEALRMF